MENAKRIEKWDNLKFLLIFMVVLGHFADLYSENVDMAKRIVFFIYSFHMPLFIFVSGLFSKRNINQKRFDKINLFLVLYLFMSLLQFFFKCIFVKGFDFSLNIANMRGVPWYAFAIFAFSIITIIIRKADPKYVLTAAVVIACIAGYDKSINEYFSFSRIIV